MHMSGKQAQKTLPFDQWFSSLSANVNHAAFNVYGGTAANSDSTSNHLYFIAIAIGDSGA